MLGEITDCGTGCRLGILRINVLAYADDLVLMASTREQLAMLYQLLKAGLRDKELIINQIKSKCMIFKKSVYTEGNVLLGDDSFEVVSQYKYLGHIIQHNLHDINDAEYRLNNFYGKFLWAFRNNKITQFTVLLL